MDDLSQKIESLLQSPDGMEKIQAAMAALSSSLPADPPAEKAEVDNLDLSALLAGLGGPSNSDKGESAPASGGVPDLSRLLPLMPLLSGMGQEDDNTALLRALRPHLHGDREKRVDGAIQMMKMMKLVPLISSLGKGGSS